MWYIFYIAVFCILLKALDEDLSKQKKALQDRINARKMKGQQKEEEEIEAYHLLMLAQSQTDKSKKVVDDEKGRQSSKVSISSHQYWSG